MIFLCAPMYEIVHLFVSKLQALWVPLLGLDFEFSVKSVYLDQGHLF